MGKQGLFTSTNKKIVGIANFTDDGKILVNINDTTIDPYEELQGFDDCEITISIGVQQVQD